MVNLYLIYDPSNVATHLNLLINKKKKRLRKNFFFLKNLVPKPGHIINCINHGHLVSRATTREWPYTQ